MAKPFKRPSLREETMRVHIDEGKKNGQWSHTYEDFETMRHTYRLNISQMQRNFNLKARSTMKEWWAVDDEEHNSHVA